MLRGYVRGRLCVWDAEAATWRWDDNGELAEGWGGEARPCPQCQQLPTAEGFDPCMGRIDGASGACCGHGVHAGYVNWPTVSAPEGWWQRAYVGERS